MLRLVFFSSVLALSVISSVGALPNLACAQSRWPSVVHRMTYTSRGDFTEQPALYYAPRDVQKPVPLLVSLHSWSGTMSQTIDVPAAHWCVREGWAFVRPNFRGKNGKPDATGSDKAIEDIMSAIDAMSSKANIDPNRIYLLGYSGGGHMALLLAGRIPDVWAGISVWGPVTDLRQWYAEVRSSPKYAHYAYELERSCGGPPGASPDIDVQYDKRSPIHYLYRASHVAIDFNAGLRDGHAGPVPIHHSVRAFNLVADPSHAIDEHDLQDVMATARLPQHLQQDLYDPTYGGFRPLFRRTSTRSRLTIFQGGHNVVHTAALSWLAQQTRFDPEQAKLHRAVIHASSHIAHALSSIRGLFNI